MSGQEIAPMSIPGHHSSNEMEEAAQELGKIYEDFASLRAKVGRATLKAVKLAAYEHENDIQQAGEERQRLIELRENINQCRKAIRIVRSASKKGNISAGRLEQACTQGSEALDDARDTPADIGMK